MSKTAREIELEKKLEIAVEALKEYADKKTWDCQNKQHREALLDLCKELKEMAQ